MSDARAARPAEAISDSVPALTIPAPTIPAPTIPAPTIPAPTIPALTVVAGRPTAEETAAVVVVLGALAARSGTPDPAGPVRSPWSARARLLRAPVMAGPDAWRASALPR